MGGQVLHHGTHMAGGRQAVRLQPYEPGPDLGNGQPVALDLLGGGQLQEAREVLADLQGGLRDDLS